MQVLTTNRPLRDRLEKDIDRFLNRHECNISWAYPEACEIFIDDLISFMVENGYTHMEEINSFSHNKFTGPAGDPVEGKVLREYFPSHPMSELIQDVRYFHLACGIPVLAAPTLPSPERVELRKSLTIEEHDETIKAMDEGDLVGIADGIADTIYIALGNALEFGIPLEYVWAEVQRSNMAKVDPVTGKVRRREDGKVLKPEGWTPPDIAGIMENV